MIIVLQSVVFNFGLSYRQSFLILNFYFLIVTAPANRRLSN
jgi:hypothetical protein